jgi:hypothetical protein
MGVLRRLALLPMAPLEGLLWLARTMEQLAEEELTDPDRLRSVLEEAERAHGRGELSDEALAAIEDDVLDRLVPARSNEEGW